MSDNNRTDLAEREQQLAAREAAIEAKERHAREQEAARRKQVAIDFAETFASDGKILPRQQKTVSGILTLLDDLDSKTVEFCDGDGQAQDVSAAEAF